MEPEASENLYDEGTSHAVIESNNEGEEDSEYQNSVRMRYKQS